MDIYVDIKMGMQMDILKRGDCNLSVHRQRHFQKLEDFVTESGKLQGIN